jgi:hypothetical protein
MTASQYRDTHDIVFAAAQWLMERHRQSGQRKFAQRVERHLDWLRDHATRGDPAANHRQISSAWRAQILSAN